MDYNVQENIGKVENRGFDFSLSAIAWQQPSDRSYLRFSVMMSHNKNTLKEISDAMKNYNRQQAELAEDENKPLSKYFDGVSMDAIWGMKSLGIDPRNGREIYLTKDGTPTYTYSGGEQVVLGDEMPKFQGTAGLSFEWKGIGGNLSFIFQYGAQMYNQTLIDKVENADLNQNVDIRLYDGVWRPGDEGQVKHYKQLG